MSEEAGIQILGPDNVAIWKVRVIVISTSSLMSLLMIKNSTAFEQIFNPEAKVENVSEAFFVHISFAYFWFLANKIYFFVSMPKKMETPHKACAEKAQFYCICLVLI